MASKFGWSYPPGAATDPMAPYNEPEVPVDTCEDCGIDWPRDQLDDGGVTEYDSGAKVGTLACPECGEPLTDWLISEPDFV